MCGQLMLTTAPASFRVEFKPRTNIEINFIMKMMLFPLAFIVFADTCSAQGLGSGLLSLLTEGFTKRSESLAPKLNTNEIEDAVSINSNEINLGRFVNPELRPSREQESSLFRTLNLSYAGNLDFTKALAMASRVGSSLAQAIGSLVDLQFVRNVVDIAVDRLNEVESGREGRSDSRAQRLERIKDGITEAVGAALGEQQCWQRTACRLGEYTAAVPGKDLIFILADRLAPPTWLGSLNIIRESATFEKNCNLFECTADPEGTEIDA